ncbi:hypothetical protein ACPVPU_05890 [Sphingomonas sp. CJ99]
MKALLALSLVALPLAACTNSPEEAVAENVEDAAEMNADAALANGATEAQAEAIEEAGENRADEIEDGNMMAMPNAM